jgi:RND family efflux transporter MFP subunit
MIKSNTGNRFFDVAERCFFFVVVLFFVCSGLAGVTHAADNKDAATKSPPVSVGTPAADRRDPKTLPTKPSPATPLSSPTSSLLPASGGLDCLIEPHKTVELATSALGVMKEMNVDRGDIVKAGDVLARLESEVEKANVAHAKARAEFAAKKHSRMDELFKEQMVSAQQLDEAKTEHDLAQAELQKATELLNQRTILSPFSAVVVERYVSPGELVENKKVIKIAQIHPLNVEIIAPVPMLGDFKMGAKVLVFPEGSASKPLTAYVKRVDRVIDASSGTFRVRLDLPNPNFKIPVGVRCKARLAQ